MMKFVIMHTGEIPGYGHVRGPVLTPQAYDLSTVLKWVSHGVDIREVMEDGSYRKLTFNDRRLKSAIEEGKNIVANEEPTITDISVLLGEKDSKNVAKDEPVKEVEIKTEEITDSKEYPNADVFEGLDEDSFDVDELEESE